MMVTKHCDAWLIIGDHYQARLLGCTTTEADRCHLTQFCAIESPIPDMEYYRPYGLTGMTGMTGHSYAENQDRLQEEYRRFAKQLGRWINNCIDRFGIEKLTVFVPDRSHAEVLSNVHHAYRDRVTLRGENLLRLSHYELCKNRLVTGLLQPHEQRQTA